jgi:hypothetical protein
LEDSNDRENSDNDSNINEDYISEMLDSIIDQHLKEVLDSDTVYEEYVDDNFVEENIEIVFEGIPRIFKGYMISDPQKEKLFQIIKLNIQYLSCGTN